MKYNAYFWKDTFERSFYTMAETALGILGTSMMMEQVNWKVVLSASVLSGIVTVLKCIAVKGDNHADGTV